MCIIFDKPFLTYADQINLIVSRNVIVANKAFANEVLCSVSYYTLMNGYKEVFLESRNPEKYYDGTTLEEIYTLHIIQNSLNNILFKYILFVENSLKTKLSYRIAEQYGVDLKIDITDSNSNYLFYKNYSNSNGHRLSVLKELIRNYQRTIQSKPNSCSSYYSNHKNHTPPWIYIRDTMFGHSIKWYSILKDSDKTNVCDQMLLCCSRMAPQSRKELLIKSFELLAEYRNKFAHGQKPFKSHMTVQLPKIQILSIYSDNIVSENDYNSGIGRSDLFSVILAILTCINDKYISNALRIDLYNLFNNYKSNVFVGKNIFEALFIPNNTIDRVNNLIKEKYST